MVQKHWLTTGWYDAKERRNRQGCNTCPACFTPAGGYRIADGTVFLAYGAEETRGRLDDVTGSASRQEDAWLEQRFYRFRSLMRERARSNST